MIVHEKKDKRGGYPHKNQGSGDSINLPKVLIEYRTLLRNIIAYEQKSESFKVPWGSATCKLLTFELIYNLCPLKIVSHKTDECFLL